KLVPVFHAEANPDRLSEWGLVVASGNRLQLAAEAVPYDLNTPLFSDYAKKLRTVWVPKGTQAKYDANNVFQFPVGTVITKTFYYRKAAGSGPDADRVLQDDDRAPQLLKVGSDLSGVKLMETRLLVRRAAGWVALPYVWNDEQTDAVLQRTGDVKRLQLVKDGKAGPEFAYVVPNTNQCAGCHATNSVSRQIEPIGPKARHLNKAFDYADGSQNQISAWVAKGMLTDVPAPAAIARNAAWMDAEASLDSRARAYLDINCSHCHSVKGAGNTSGLTLEPDAPQGRSLGVCKLPIAAGAGTGNRAFDIVPGEPDKSIFMYRLASTDPGSMMPEVGRSTSHAEGVALIREWIAQMDGDCGPA
ncbi:MAG: SO2930 family diheme c-type cytochrome, partial [Sandaracinobacteroides sp.]